MIQHFEVEIKGYKGYDMAQVTAGRIHKEIIQGTLESKVIRRALCLSVELLVSMEHAENTTFSGHLHLDTSAAKPNRKDNDKESTDQAADRSQRGST